MSEQPHAAGPLTMPDLFLHDHAVSSYASKVRIMLREKGIPFQKAVPEDSGRGNRVPALEHNSPRKEVPVLEDRTAGISIFDSTVILEYLEDTWPEPTVRPPTPAARARARMIEDMVDTAFEAINWSWGEVQIRSQGEEQAKLQENLRKQIDILSSWLETQLDGKPYFNGSDFGWADVCVAPFVNRSMTFGLAAPTGSQIDEWFTRVSTRPSVKETLDEMTEGAKAAKLSAIFLESPPGTARRQYRDHRLEMIVKVGGLDIVLAGMAGRNIRFSWPEIGDAE